VLTDQDSEEHTLVQFDEAEQQAVPKRDAAVGGGRARRAKAEAAGGEWVCEVCTSRNADGAEKCVVCKRPHGHKSDVAANLERKNADDAELRRLPSGRAWWLRLRRPASASFAASGCAAASWRRT